MKVLVISGEVSQQRPLTYGLPRDWTEKTVAVVDQELEALVLKYGDVKSVPPVETGKFLVRSAGRIIREVRDPELSVVVATGAGVHVAQTLIDSRDWNGPTVFVDPEGTFRRTQFTLPDECEFDFEAEDPGPDTRRTAWILRGNTSSSQMKRIRSLRDSSCIVTVSESDFYSAVYGSSLLESCIKIVTR